MRRCSGGTGRTRRCAGAIGRLCVRPPAEEFQLFDLAKDIGETRNVAADRPEVLRELTAAWNQMNSQMVPPLWGPNEQGRRSNSAGWIQ